MERQGKVDRVDSWVDTDDAGGKETRQSTSGGLIRMGRHVVKVWTNTQSVIALSSVEAEYCGLVKAPSIAMGIRRIMADLGIERRIRVMTDSPAAFGVSKIRGRGTSDI